MKPKDDELQIEVSTRTVKTHEATLEEDELRELVRAHLPEALRDLPELVIRFDGGEFSEVQCTIKWEQVTVVKEKP